MLRWERRSRGAELAEIEAVYRRRLGELRRVAAAIMGERESACDVVQDAFVTAVRERETFRGEGPLDAWLWRIVVNHARSARRVAPAHAELPETHIASSNGNSPSGSELVRAALAALPERQRLILFLRYYADLDYGTIAAVADVAPGTVAATLNAGRRALRGLMEEVHR
jgi:RNA polymerase sigma-70 factor, ECF subfamily